MSNNLPISEMYAYAEEFSIIPTKRDKKPNLPQWKEYQTKRLEASAIPSCFNNRKTFGVAVICGVISGGVEVIDFDDHGSAYPAWAERVNQFNPDLLNKLAIELTPSGGFHVIYRVAGKVKGNTKLATNKEGVCTIESRGEGGYFVTCPTEGYVLQGKTQSLVYAIHTITEDERDMLWIAAQSLDEAPPKQTKKSAERPSPGAAEPGARPRGQLEQLSPGDDYSRRGDLKTLLQDYGWEPLEEGGETPRGIPTEYWVRPGKDAGEGHSASYYVDETGVQRFHVFSSNAAPFETGQVYDGFQCFCLLKHYGLDNDGQSNAARRLAYLGFGTKKQEEPTDELVKQLQELNTRFAVLRNSGEVLILDVEETEKSGSLVAMRENAFDLLLRDRRIQVETRDGMKSVSLKKLWLEWSGRRIYSRITCDPTNSCAKDEYNLYRGFAITPAPGKWDLIRKHIEEVICDGNKRDAEYLYDWLAQMVQHPQIPAKTAIVIRGTEGCGKGTLIDVIVKEMFPPSHGVMVSSTKAVVGEYNSILDGKILIYLNEIRWSLRDSGFDGELRSLITDSTHRSHAKYRNQITLPNTAHLMFSSNEDFVVPIYSPNDRRFFVLDASSKHRSDREYFDPLYKEIENGGRQAFLDFLLKRDISRYNPEDFRRTAGWREQILLNDRNGVLTFWLERLREGTVFYGHDWVGPVAKETVWNAYASFTRSRKVPDPKTSVDSFWREFNKFFGHKLNETKISSRNASTSDGRVRAVRFPEFEDCRKSMLKYLKIEPTENFWEDGSVELGENVVVIRQHASLLPNNFLD